MITRAAKSQVVVGRSVDKPHLVGRLEKRWKQPSTTNWVKKAQETNYIWPNQDFVVIIQCHCIDPGRQVVISFRALRRGPVGLGHAHHVANRERLTALKAQHSLDILPDAVWCKLIKLLQTTSCTRQAAGGQDAQGEAARQQTD